MKILHRIWQEIISGQNLDIYINIALAVVVVALSIFGIATQYISSATLAILALLLTSLLVNRHNSENLKSEILKLKKAET